MYKEEKVMSDDNKIIQEKTKKRLEAKLPGEDTGIVLRNTFCDICTPAPHCGITCYVKDEEIIKIEGTDAHPANHGKLCTKGYAAREYVYRDDRIKTPLRRTGPRGSGQFEPVSWDEALDETAERLNRIKKESGASSVGFYAGYEKWYRPFLQRLTYAFGSVNYGCESSSCNTSTVMAWKCTAGVESVQPDMKNSGVFLGWCANPGTSKYMMYKGMLMNRKRGMKIIIIDTRITPASQNCDLFLRIKQGTDGALALGLGRELIEKGWIDKDFIEKNVYGFDAYKAYVSEFTPERTSEITGIPPEDIRAAAQMLHENMPMSIYTSSAALVHFKNGFQNYRAVMSLAIITGCYGVPGGMMPGVRTYSHSPGGFETLEHEFSTELYPENEPLPVGCERFPLWHRLVGEMQACDMSRAILTGKPYPLRAVYAHGMNFRMFPGSDEMEEALKKLDFFADMDLFMTDTARYADIVFPACTSFERDEFKVYPGGFAQYTEPVIKPLYDSGRDDDVIIEMAKRLGLTDPLITSDRDSCLRYMLRNTPIDLEMLREHPELPVKIEGIQMKRYAPGVYDTPSGKLELDSLVIKQLYDTAPGDRVFCGPADGRAAMEDHGMPVLNSLPAYEFSADDPPESEYPMLLSAGIRNPGHIHSRLEGCSGARSLRPEPAADINVKDAEKYGLKDGDSMRISTPHGSIRIKVHPTIAVPERMVAFAHGYAAADVNTLLSPEHRDPYSGFPGYRCVRCRIEKIRL